MKFLRISILTALHVCLIFLHTSCIREEMNACVQYKLNTQAVEALNFQITIAIAYVAGSVLMAVLIGFLIIPVVILVNLVFCILAGMACNKGESYRYPFALRLIK